jgi:hypothetical protein
MSDDGGRNGWRSTILEDRREARRAGEDKLANV